MSMVIVSVVICQFVGNTVNKIVFILLLLNYTGETNMHVLGNTCERDFQQMLCHDMPVCGFCAPAVHRPNFQQLDHTRQKG